MPERGLLLPLRLAVGLLLLLALELHDEVVGDAEGPDLLVHDQLELRRPGGASD